MTERKQISKKIRFDVFKRDFFKCQYCGAHPPAVVLEVDHINPVCKGGKNNIDNLITSCFNCNRGKSGTPLTVVPKSLAEKAAEVGEMELQIKGYRKVMQARADRIDSDMWGIAEILEPGCSADGMKKAKLQSIKTFLARLDALEIEDAAEIATSKFPWNKNQCFSYFCGICWSKIKEASNGAR